MEVMRKSLLVAVAFFTPVCMIATGSSVNRPAQKMEHDTVAGEVKLKFSSELLVRDGDDLQPIALSPHRLLVPAGDTLYMLDAGNRIVWDYSFGGNNITDVMIDPEGTIYATVLDGLLIALDASGNKVWSNFLNGSGNYVRIKSYKGSAFLVVVDMSAYRERFDTEDKLQLWENREFVWSKDFPRGAQLCIWGDTILAITRTGEAKIIKKVH